MAELLALLALWQTLMLVLVVFGIAPGLALRLIVLLFHRDDPRRRELVAELYAVPRIERPLWVAEQLDVAFCEGLWERIGRAATSGARRLTGCWSRRVGQCKWLLRLKGEVGDAYDPGPASGGASAYRIKVTCTLLRAGQTPAAVRAEWLFNSANPFAVTLSLTNKPVDWMIGRELLATGLWCPVGDGDVRIEPMLGDLLLIELRSPSGHALLLLDAAEARRALDLSYASVPLGTETRATDLDAELAAICDHP